MFKHSLPFVLLFSAVALAACQKGGVSSSLGSSGAGSSADSVSSNTGSSNTSSQGSSSSSSSGKTSSSSSSKSSSSATSSVTSGHTQNEVDDYVAGLKKSSKSRHLYYHYLRYDNAPSSYSDWDVWAWPFTKEGYRFDWHGRETSSDRLSATGLAVVDSFSGAYVDIDLSASYDGGWKSASKTMGGTSMSFLNSDGSLVEKVGLQIVSSATRTSSAGFWVNDGGNLFIELSKYALANSDGTTSYHVFAVQDQVQSAGALPKVSIVDPFAKDDGTNVTYNNSQYKNVDWSDKALASTSPLFLKGDSSKSYLTSGAGVGYQIMVASFADSDGDGFGDIYGIDQKLDYLKALGVNVLWLTPIQLSDSYHGYDITNYYVVDPKFGSKVSPAGKTSGSVSSDSALEDYKLLLKDANSRGMAVIMDLVLNHTSTSNDWFIKSAQLSAEYRGYYQWGNHETQTAIKEDNYWYPYGDHPYSYYAKFGSSMPELNYSYQATRDAVIDMAKYWCSLGVNGFRMDAVKHLFLNDEVTTDTNDTIINDISTDPKTGKTLNYSSNLTKNINFWREVNSRVKTSYPNAFFVGENFDGHAYHIAPFYEGFDSLFDFYSYFNITSSAAHALNSGVGKGIQSYDGYVAGDAYTTAADHSSDKGLSNSTSSVKFTGNWNVASIMATNDHYRTGSSSLGSDGYSFINGAFTSNHDIARAINRVAGSGDASGVSSQGTITANNYATYLKAATCAEIAEIMMPGCSWIYYGDELGMTGNWQNGATSSTDSYADLSYRQPMKWKQDGAVGDGSFTTGYAVTGSGTKVAWDEVNSTSAVTSVESCDNSEHYLGIQRFAKLKSTTPALIRGSYTAYGWNVNNSPVDYVYNVVRELSGVKYNIVVNFSASQTLSAGFTGTLVAHYNGGSLTSLPPFSAIAVKL